EHRERLEWLVPPDVPVRPPPQAGVVARAPSRPPPCRTRPRELRSGSDMGRWSTTVASGAAAVLLAVLPASPAGAARVVRITNTPVAEETPAAGGSFLAW